MPTRLICFSDDMDGLRKVPGNVPNQEAMRAYINQPLTKVPDPFGEYESFGARQQCAPARVPRPLRLRLRVRERDRDYKAGRFDAMLLKMLAAYDEVMAIMLPSLREERQQSYSPFLPVSPVSGAVLQVPIVERNVDCRHRRLPRSRQWRQADRGAGHRRQRQVPVEGRLGAALGGARHRLRDVGQGPDRLGQAVEPHLRSARRRAAGGVQLRALPRRARGRRSPSRRATA